MHVGVPLLHLMKGTDTCHHPFYVQAHRQQMQLKKQRQETLDEETRTYLERLNARDAEIQELEKHRQQAVRSRNINLKWVQGTTCQLQLPCMCHLPLSLGDQSQRQPRAGMLSQVIMASTASKPCCTREGQGVLPQGRQVQEPHQAGAALQGACHVPCLHRSDLQDSCTSHSGLHSGLRQVALLHFIAYAELQVLTQRLKEVYASHVVGLCRLFLDAQYWTVFSVLSAG